jgi:hypothetical protein
VSGGNGAAVFLDNTYTKQEVSARPFCII